MDQVTELAEIDQIIKKHFGTTNDACDALGVTKGAVSQWRISGIPKLRRFHIDAVIAAKRKRAK